MMHKAVGNYGAGTGRLPPYKLHYPVPVLEIVTIVFKFSVSLIKRGQSGRQTNAGDHIVVIHLVIGDAKAANGQGDYCC